MPTPNNTTLVFASSCSSSPGPLPATKAMPAAAAGVVGAAPVAKLAPRQASRRSAFAGAGCGWVVVPLGRGELGGRGRPLPPRAALPLIRPGAGARPPPPALARAVRVPGGAEGRRRCRARGCAGGAPPALRVPIANRKATSAFPFAPPPFSARAAGLRSRAGAAPPLGPAAATRSSRRPAVMAELKARAFSLTLVRRCTLDIMGRPQCAPSPLGALLRAGRAGQPERGHPAPSHRGRARGQRCGRGHIRLPSLPRMLTSRRRSGGRTRCGNKGRRALFCTSSRTQPVAEPLLVALAPPHPACDLDPCTDPLLNEAVTNLVSFLGRTPSRRTATRRAASSSPRRRSGTRSRRIGQRSTARTCGTCCATTTAAPRWCWRRTACTSTTRGSGPTRRRSRREAAPARCGGPLLRSPERRVTATDRGRARETRRAKREKEICQTLSA